MFESISCDAQYKQTKAALAAVRSFFGSASHVRQVTASLFDDMLDRVNDNKPSNLVDQWW